MASNPPKKKPGRKSSSSLPPINNLKRKKSPGSSTSIKKISSATIKGRKGSAANLKAIGDSSSSQSRVGEGLSRSIPVRSPVSVTFPLWLKFAGFACFLLSFMIVIFGIISSQLMQKEIGAQINNTGIKLVSFVTTTIGPYWIYEEGNLEKAKKEIQQKLGSFRKEDPDITDILLLQMSEKGRFLMASASGKNKVEMGPDPITLSSNDKIKIQQTELNGILTRVFSKPLYDNHGKKVGEALVYLKASRIQEVKNAFAWQIIMICILGILVGGGLTFIVTKFLTSPIQSLVEDILVVSTGNLEHQTIPKSQDEIGFLAATFNEMTEKLRIAREEEIKKKALQHELEIATEIQTELLPEQIPKIPGYDIFAYYLSAKHVGGDYYDFIVIDQERLGIVVADVSGKGIPGSMVMTMARSLIRMASRRNPSPADTLRRVNKVLAQDMRRGMFVTANYLVLNVRTKQLTVASAGHNPLVVYRNQTKDIELIKPQGIALGFDKGQIFDANIAEETIQLYRGDRIVAYTDGVVEAMSENDQEFGEETFYDLTRKYGSASSKDYINILIQALEEHRGNAEQSDDITITTLRVG
ncbi:MAG: HAMP domain-containing protein [Planctomycetota bacterium]|nr:MAG: HAMP domain-containing protein [Planctomycetota bacterium]